MSQTRRLAAILAADVAGYSRLIGADEQGTLNKLRSIRTEVVDAKINEHHGRLVKTTGDGLLVEFGSVVDALRCATEIQQQMTARNAQAAVDSRIEFRIGLNVGDIVVEDGDIFGDGVNVAARLEGLAEPGGICVSARVQEDAAGKLDLNFEDIGEQALKNIARPIRVYRVRIGGTAPTVLAIRAVPALALPDKPSIAVLPFQNMSGDPEQEYFVDGMVEEIITALSRIRWLFVIARNSSFTYKGQSVDVKRVGRELGVRYVLEGSVRKASNRVRITGELIDAATGTHLWADRFDGSLEEVFELQDQVAGSVVGAIEPKLRLAEIERASRKPTSSLDAYDLYLRALAEVHKWTAESFQATIELLHRALFIDPSYAPAAALIAYCRGWQHAYSWQALSDKETAEAIGLARSAVESGKDDPDALWMAGQFIGYFVGDYVTALGLIDRALALNGNSALAWCARGYVLTFANQAEPAIESFANAMRLSPFDPLGSMFKTGIAGAHSIAGRLEEALAWIDKSLQEHPGNIHALRWKASLYGLLGKAEEGRRCVRELLTVFPDANLKSLEQRERGRMNPPKISAMHLDGLRKVGLPEG